MSVALVQQATGTKTFNVGGATATFGSSVGAGNAVVVVVASAGQTAGAYGMSAPTDSKGNTYHSCQTEGQGTSGGSLVPPNVELGYYVAYNVAGGSSFVVTCHPDFECCGGCEFPYQNIIAVFEVSGMGTSNPFDQSNHAGSTTTVASSGGITPSNPNSFLIAASVAAGASAGTIVVGDDGGGWSTATNLSAGSFFGTVNLGFETEVITGGGSASASLPISTGTRHGQIIGIASFCGPSTITGTATTNWHLSGSGTTGTVKIPSTAASSWHLGGSTTGHVKIPSTASASWGFTGLALEGVLAGPTSASWGYSGSATGHVKIPSTGAAAWSFSGELSDALIVVPGTGTTQWAFRGLGGPAFLAVHASGAARFSWSATSHPILHQAARFRFSAHAVGTVTFPDTGAPDTAGRITVYAYTFGQPFILKNELPVTGLKWSQRLNTEGSVSGNLNLADPDVVAMGGPENTEVNKTLLIVDVDGSILVGAILNGNPYNSTTRIMALKGAEVWSYMAQILQAFDYTTGPNGGSGVWWNGNPDLPQNIAAQIVSDVLDIPLFALPELAIVPEYNLSSDVNAVYGSYPLSNQQTVDQIVSQLSQGAYLTGFDFGIDWFWIDGPGGTPGPVLTLSYPTRERTTSETALVIDLDAAIEWTWTSDGTEQANYVSGSASGSTTLLSTKSVAPLGGYARFQATYQPQTVGTQDELDAATEGQLAVTELPPTTCTVKLPMFNPNGISITDLRMGDDADVTCGKGDPRWPLGMHTSLRLVGIDADASDAGNPTMLLTLSPIPSLAPVQPLPFPS